MISKEKIFITVKLPKIISDESLHMSSSDSVMQLAQKTHTKTKKKKVELSNTDKSKLWDIFDADKKQIDTDPSNIECVYSEKSELDLCNLCKSNLMIMDNGFPTCVNTECGVIYKDILDYSPELRFY